MRRNIQILGWALIWTGLFVFGYLGWQLFGTDLVNERVQAEAADDLVDFFQIEREHLPQVEAVEGQDEPLEYHPEEEPVENTEFARLILPKLGLDVVVFEGVTRETLAQGPGHMPGTPLPGQPGNAVISGHRTTHGRPFFDFDLLQPGDRIEVETSIGTHVYEVRESLIVAPTDVWVTDDKAGGWLTLTTCNPKFSARERLIISAEMVEGPNLAYIQDLEDRLIGVS
ncbi:MAG TPA: sortase [Acidimicrobiia bacterium]|nr:sortase [Acidimicrobiia bacterium]